MIIQVLFWLCFVALLHTYVLYPWVTWALTEMKRSDHLPVQHGSSSPFVSVVVAFHNEPAILAHKMRNLAQLDYPEGAIEILLGSNGSSDRSCEIVRSCGLERVRLIAAGKESARRCTWRFSAAIIHEWLTRTAG